MTRSKIAEPQYTLAGISIFSALPPNSLNAVHRRCSWRRYEQGEPIVDYLDASDNVFFVTTGEVCVTIYSLAGKAVSFRNLGTGDIFGEYAAIDGEPRSASVEARTSCLIASMPAKEFRKLLKKLGVKFEEQNIENAGYQVFLHDPVGTKLEFNFLNEQVPDAVPRGTTAQTNLVV